MILLNDRMWLTVMLKFLYKNIYIFALKT